MRKALLVASREFAENVRTKTFWIGILAVPVFLGVVIAVTAWLQGSKAVRRYAVVDRSGWLLGQVEKRAECQDLERLLMDVRQRAEGRRSLQDYPDVLGRLAPSLGRLSPEQVAALARQLSGAEGGAGADPLGQPPLESELVDDLERWWRSLDTEEAGRLDAELARARFQRVDLGALEGDPEAQARRLVASDEVFACFVIGEEPEQGKASCRYLSRNLTDRDLLQWFSGLATEEVRARRFAARGLDQKEVQEVLSPLAFAARRVSAAGAETDVRLEDRARQWVPVAFVYILWLAVLVAVQLLLTNTTEEKANRTMEVLLSSVSALQLMSGKIVGIASTSLVMVGSWLACVALAIKLVPMALGFQIPFGLGALLADPAYLASFLVYFLFGYLFFAGLVAGIGSVCTTVKEAQNLWGPVMLIFILPLLAMEPIGRDPNGPLARVLSFVPPFTPFVMMNRAAGPPAAWEYVLTTLLMLASVTLTFWAAAKVFRVGILMTGKPPRLREILRWVRAPVGSVPARRQERS